MPRAGNSRLWLLALAVLLFVLPPGIAGTDVQKPPATSAQGIFLVARPDLSDPLFAKSVVLMLPVKGTPLLVGLIVNKPTRVPLHEFFADSPALQKRGATAYFGGPVDADSDSLSALFRSSSPPKEATRVFGDVYVSFDAATIGGLVENFQQASEMRIFVGRAQWAPAQLDNEIAIGGWYSVRSGADPIFSNRPEDAWRVLLGQAAPRPLVELPPSFPLCDFPPASCGARGAVALPAFWTTELAARPPAPAGIL